jgi:hypothetical protein
MDDARDEREQRAQQVTSRTAAAVLGTALLAYVAHAAFGTTGLQVVLVLLVGAGAFVAFHRASGRELVGFAALRRAPKPEPEEPAVEDHWKSERWVGEAVERGLRSLDAWRFDQQAT